MRGLFFRFLRVVFLALGFGWGLTMELTEAKPAKPPKILDLNDTVMANHIMTKFAVLVRGSGLGSFLSSRGPFILFVPADSAFSKLPPGTVDALLQPQNHEALQRIVLFHLVNGKRLSAKDLIPLKTLLSCEGSTLPLHVNRSGAQLVMKAKIIHADIRCANGLIHEIDTLLVPPGLKLPEPGAAPAASTDGAAGTNTDTPADAASAPPTVGTDTSTNSAAPIAPAAPNP